VVISYVYLRKEQKEIQTYHVKSRFREGIVCAGKNFPERANSILKGDEFALVAGKHLRYLEGLRHEPLDLTSTLDLVVSSRY
jgi:hypothetical protein